MIRLYEFAPSGNCHKVRLFLSLLGLDYRSVPIDVTQGEQKAPAFLALNPRGEVPVMQDDEVLLWDSAAILIYLAERYAAPEWLGDSADARGRIQQWLGIAGNEIQHSLAHARAINKLGIPGNAEAARARARILLSLFETHLRRNDFLVDSRITIAECACYPYIALAGESGVELSPYPALRAWLNRIQSLHGYLDMPGMYSEAHT